MRLRTLTTKLMTHKRAVELYDECWKIQLLMIWDIDSAGFGEFMRRKFDLEFDNQHTGEGYFTVVDCDDGTHKGIIAMNNGPFTGTPAQYATLTHEIIHATNHLLTRRGLKQCRKSEEAFTYTAGYFVEQLAEKMLKKEAKL